MDQTKYNDFTQTICRWYKNHGRDLPWRRTRDPYCIWISEIMLQQTQVETVRPYYERFIAAFPDVEALSNASQDQVYKLWEGLGYYRRASHLMEAAKTVMSRYGGRFPQNYEDILSLKGIGAYTASAIASIAFHIPKGVIDGNTLRIISRVLNCQENIGKDATKKLYQKIMDTWIAFGDPSDFNQGMMDLGAMICTPKNPSCHQCPVKDFCQAFAQGTQKLLPVNIKNKNKEDIYLITGILKYKDRYFLIKNQEGLLADLYGFVQYEVESPLSFEEEFYRTYHTGVRLLEYEKEFRHIFSHRVWHMSVYDGELENGDDARIREHLYTWDQLMALPIPTAHKKILEAVCSREQEKSPRNT
ncbi:MAG TPA: A/G-specific adenine glycosylase [Candidatus Scybalocola faecavium]|nr:A/G-specific adenine glycosylase [Candidatus Scybalocola faecavium]